MPTKTASPASNSSPTTRTSCSTAARKPRKVATPTKRSANPTFRSSLVARRPAAGEGGVKPTGFDLYRYSLPLRSPLALKGTTLRNREGLLLRLYGDDGSEGWRESAPLPGFSEEALDEPALQLRRPAETLMGCE